MLGYAQMVVLRLCWRGETLESKAQEAAEGPMKEVFSGCPKKSDARSLTAGEVLGGRYYDDWYR